MGDSLKATPASCTLKSMVTDRIRLRGMRFYGYHGVLEAERALGQRFVVDVELALDLRPAGMSDDLALTVSYAEVFEQARDVVEGPPCRLIEAVAERVAGRILDAHDAVEQVRVRVRKPGAPIKGALDTAEVEVVRTR